MILINTHEISKAYAGRSLFKNISFGIDDGDRVGLVGPNGAGKSTLLRILTGQIEPDSGRVSRKKGLCAGFMEQSPPFSPGATILSAVLEKVPDKSERLPKAMEIMAHLELNRFGEETPIQDLSGGWKKRVALARELVLEPELLILDEPTNHLDVTSILWLEEYLRNYLGAILMVTHDRLFLQRVCTRVLDLDPRNPNDLLNIKGDYAQYLEAKDAELMAQARHEKVQRNRLRREIEWLGRGALARQTKQSARIQGAAELRESVDELKAKNHIRRIDLDFGDGGRAPQKLIEANQLAKAYGPSKLFSEVDLLVTPQSRLALLGDNGCGKSTLIRILLGQEAPDNGHVRRAEGLQFAYFEQSRQSLRPELSVLKNVCPEGEYVHVQGEALHVRSYLDRFHFGGDKAEMPVSRLSGGEQARLRLAQLMMQSAQILILDEPTNDLDAETLELLEESLRSFSGAVILVTHDRYFMDAVANQIVAFPGDAGVPGKLEKFASYFQWESWRANELKKKQKKTPAKVETSRDAPELATRARLSYKEKFELDNMETTILKIEDEIAGLNAQVQSPEIMADHRRLHEVLSALSERQAELEAKYQRWSELEARKE